MASTKIPLVHPSRVSLGDLLALPQIDFPSGFEVESFNLPSSLSPAEVEHLVKAFDIKDDFEAIVPSPTDRPCKLNGRLCVFKESLISGLRLPFHSFRYLVLAKARISSAQLHPNGYKTIHTFLGICRIKEVEPTMGVFRRIFQFKSCSPMEGWVTIKHRHNILPIFATASMPESLSGWKSEYFFLRLKIGQGESLIRTSFGVAHDGPVKQLRLGSDELDTMKVLQEGGSSVYFMSVLEADKYQELGLCNLSPGVELLINAARGLLPSSEFEKFIRHADDKNGDTALHLAVRNNNVETVNLLAKADPNHTHSLNKMSKSPLYIAAEQGFKDIVQVICESCATPSFDGPNGKTALHAAIENRDTDSVRSILDKRGYLILKGDDIGWTATDYAASKNFLSVLDILIKTENNQFHDYSECKQFFMHRPHKETAFHRAAFQARISTVLQLMKLYPDFIWCAVNKDGQNILHIAVDQNHKELVQAILQYCPDLSLILNTKDEKGNTPLHLLVMRGCFILELIRHQRVDRNAKNNENFTPYELLYLDQEVVADQLKIKEAFEDSELINQRSKFGLRKRNIPELITAESLVVPSTRYIKDAKFKKARNLLLKEEIKLYRERTNTQIIVTALITTVTFTVGFTMPGGYHQEEGQSNQGSAVRSKKTAFRVFTVADTIALLLSTSSLLSYFMASMYQDPHEVSKLMSASTGLNIVSIVAMMLTFITGTYVVLPHSGLALTLCVISCIFFLHVIFLLIKWLYDPIEKFKV